MTSIAVQVTARKPLRILIVDDQLVVRAAIRSALDSLARQLQVIEVDNGQEALAVMSRTKVDIVFSDIHLPGISGPEALAQAYGGAEALERPFLVLMSAMQPENARAIGRALGVYEFLPKPFKAADVHRAIGAFEKLSQPRRLLLVDDSNTARVIMRRILERSRFNLQISEAFDGDDALKKAQDGAFDVFFLDFNMPGLTGPEVAAMLQRQSPHAQIVIVSAEQETRMISAAQVAGAFCYLKKPFTPNDVDVVLHNAFSMVAPSMAQPSHAIFSSHAGVKRAGSPSKAS